MPGSPAVDAADERGLAALAVLRAMGLPTLVGLVQEPNNSLKEKSAAKKRGRALLDREVRVLGPGADQPRTQPKLHYHRRVNLGLVSLLLKLRHSASCMAVCVAGHPIGTPALRSNAESAAYCTGM